MEKNTLSLIILDILYKKFGDCSINVRKFSNKTFIVYPINEVLLPSSRMLGRTKSTQRGSLYQFQDETILHFLDELFNVKNIEAISA